MKSEVVKKYIPSVGFPKIMEDTHGIIVLMHSPGCGLLVGTSTGHYPPMQYVGYQSSTWDMSYFKDFHGVVTLSNT